MDQAWAGVQLCGSKTASRVMGCAAMRERTSRSQVKESMPAHLHVATKLRNTAAVLPPWSVPKKIRLFAADSHTADGALRGIMTTPGLCRAGVDSGDPALLQNDGRPGIVRSPLPNGIHANPESLSSDACGPLVMLMKPCNKSGLSRETLRNGHSNT